MCTANDLPFADDMTEAITGFLSARDYYVIPIFVKAGDEQARVMNLMSANKADRNLLIIVKR